MTTTDFETRLSQAMKTLAPDEAEFGGPAGTTQVAPVDDLAAARRRRHTRPAALVVSGLAVAAAAAAVVVAVDNTGVDRGAPPADTSSTHAPSVAPAVACGAGLIPDSTALALSGSAGLPTSTPNGYSPIGSITVTLHNSAAACTLSREPRVSIDSRKVGLFHLPVPVGHAMPRPVTVPAGGDVRYRITFRKIGQYPGELANVVVQVGSAPARTTPFVRTTNTFGVAPIELDYVGISR